MEAQQIIEGLERAIIVMDAALEHRLKGTEQFDERIVALFDPFERVIDDISDERLAAELRRRLREVEDRLEDLRHHLRGVADSSLYDPLRALGTDIALESGTTTPAPPLVVHARRATRPDGWTLVLEELSVFTFGFTHEEALADLVAAVRARVRDVLTEPPEGQSRRALAHDLQLAELQGRLGDVLTEALVLDDERVERLLREHEQQSRDRG